MCLDSSSAAAKWPIDSPGHVQRTQDTYCPTIFDPKVQDIFYKKKINQFDGKFSDHSFRFQIFCVKGEIIQINSFSLSLRNAGAYFPNIVSLFLGKIKQCLAV